MTTVVRSRRKQKTPVERVAELLVEYAPLVAQVKAIGARTEVIKAQLVTLLLEGGTEDEKKSRWIELDVPVDGVRAIKHERRVSTYIDSALARQVLEKRARAVDDPGLIGRCTQTTVVITGLEADVLEALQHVGLKVKSSTEQLDQDAVMHAYAAKEITARDVDAMTVESENFAFKLIS